MPSRRIAVAAAGLIIGLACWRWASRPPGAPATQPEPPTTSRPAASPPRRRIAPPPASPAIVAETPAADGAPPLTIAEVLAIGDRLAAASSSAERAGLRHDYTSAAAQLQYAEQRTAFWRLEQIDHPSADAAPTPR